MSLSTETGVMHSASAACRLSGISYRQLDYMVRVGVVRPLGGNGSGSARRFTDHQVRVLGVLRRLRLVGLGMERLAPIADLLTHHEASGWLVVPLEEGPALVAEDDAQLLAEVAVLGGATVIEL